MSDFTHPFAGIFLAENNVPTTYEGIGTGIAFGENARHLSDKQLESGLILDAYAAQILCEKGIDVGFTAVKKTAVPFSEHFPDNDRTCEINDPNGTFYIFTLSENAQVLSNFNGPDGSFPACYFYKNVLGQQFAIYTFDAYTLRYFLSNNKGGTVISAGRHDQLYMLYTLLSGNKLPAEVPCSPELYMIQAQRENTLSVLLCNVYPDKVYSPVLKLDGDYRVLSSINCTAQVNRNNLSLSTMTPYSFSAIELEKII